MCILSKAVFDLVFCVSRYRTLGQIGQGQALSLRYCIVMVASPIGQGQALSLRYCIVMVACTRTGASPVPTVVIVRNTLTIYMIPYLIISCMYNMPQVKHDVYYKSTTRVVHAVVTRRAY